MTDTTREILEKHEIRKTKKQKADFRDFLAKRSSELGYRSCVEKGVYGARNVVIGSPTTAKVVYTAHYDTPAGVPFPNLITPKCIPLYILYQLLISVLLFTVPMLIILLVPGAIMDGGGSPLLAGAFILIGYALLLGECYLLVAGPANKHNSNDNTSGVTVLLDLMEAMPAEKRQEVAFIFFDLEEMGCLGSQSYRKNHAKAMKTVPVINFDCVSDGETILFAVGKKAAGLSDKLKEAYVSNGTFTVDIATKGVFYPSDQKSFELGVGVAALNKTKHGLLYTSRIHTKNDTVYNEANIAFLVDGSVKLAQII